MLHRLNSVFLNLASNILPFAESGALKLFSGRNKKLSRF